MRSVELFVGAGGLALGASRAGFKHALVTDWNHDACETIRENQRRKVEHVKRWPLVEGDVRELDFASVPEGVDLLAGAPPCQPFSIGGKHRAHQDQRDMFGEVARAVRILSPRAIIVENVRGLARRRFANYFWYIQLRLMYPEIGLKAGEDWTDHRARLERYHTKGRRDGLWYRVVPRIVNAADFGVPQSRERVVIVGFRSDLDMGWTFPEATHSRDALLVDQWVTGAYWERHAVSSRRRPAPPAAFAARIAELRSRSLVSLGEPWRTVRDALDGLPAPSQRDNPPILNHRFQDGARPYVGHTGSPYDQPAKTLKAGDHGVPGGENMLVMDDGAVRYFSVREAARLQTFPDDYAFSGAWSENMRQIGNAVPVKLGEVIARSVRAKLAA